MANQRLETLMTCSEPQYSQGCPILLEACALYLDTKTNSCIAQLKWRNIAPRTVLAVAIEIYGFDAFGKQLEPVSYQYSNFSVPQGAVFGDKKPVFIKDNKTVKFEVAVQAVSFADNTIWSADAPIRFEPLPPAKPPVPFEEELFAQLERDLGQRGFRAAADHQPQIAKGLWQCGCGRWQYENTPCLSCGASQEVLSAAYDRSVLGQHLLEYKQEQERLEEEQRIAREKAEEEQRIARKKAKAERIEAKKRRHRTQKKIAISLACAVVLCISGMLLWQKVIFPALTYSSAEKALAEGKYDEALLTFRQIPDYKDASSKVETCCSALYNEAIRLYNKGTYAQAWQVFRMIPDYQDAHAQIQKCFNALSGHVSAGYEHTVGLKADGTVVAVGDNSERQCNVSGWTDIVAVSAGGYHTVGLKADGTVVAVGRNFYGQYGQCNVSGWTDIVAVAAGYDHTVGLKADGTVVAVGSNDDGQCDVSGWTDIVAVSAGKEHTVGLMADGTVVAVGSDYQGQCNVSGWKDIVAVSAGYPHTVGLKADGTVVAVGENWYGQCDVSNWTDVVAVSTGDCYHTVGLKADGTVVATKYKGKNDDGQCDVSGWTDIVAVSAGNKYTIGLKSDGTVVAMGNTDKGKCNVSGWDLWD